MTDASSNAVSEVTLPVTLPPNQFTSSSANSALIRPAQLTGEQQQKREVQANVNARRLAECDGPFASADFFLGAPGRFGGWGL